MSQEDHIEISRLLAKIKEQEDSTHLLKQQYNKYYASTKDIHEQYSVLSLQAENNVRELETTRRKLALSEDQEMQNQSILQATLTKLESTKKQMREREHTLRRVAFRESELRQRLSEITMKVKEEHAIRDAREVIIIYIIPILFDI